MYIFSPHERVQHQGQEVSLASVWERADQRDVPYVYMLDGCGLGNGVAYPVTRERLIAELAAEFKFARSTGMGPFVHVFENADGQWTQFSAREMKQRLEKQECRV
jgi:hypothetical protein